VRWSVFPASGAGPRGPRGGIAGRAPQGCRGVLCRLGPLSAPRSVRGGDTGAGAALRVPPGLPACLCPRVPPSNPGTLTVRASPS